MVLTDTTDVRAVRELISGIRQVPRVCDVRYSAAEGEGGLDLWVLITSDADGVMDTVADVDYEFRRSSAVPYNLHVIPLDQVAGQDLPPSQSV